jgi:hypothetical protein
MWESGVIAPLFLTSELDGGEESGLRPSLFGPGEAIHWQELIKFPDARRDQYLPWRWSTLPEANCVSSIGRIPLSELVSALIIELLMERIPIKTLLCLSKIWHNFLSFIQRSYHKSGLLTEFPALKFISSRLPVNKANNYTFANHLVTLSNNTWPTSGVSHWLHVG